MLSTIIQVIRNVVSPFQIVLRHLYRGDIYQRLQEVNLGFLSPIQSQILIFYHRYHHPEANIWPLEKLIGKIPLASWIFQQAREGLLQCLHRKEIWSTCFEEVETVLHEL